MRLGFRFGFEFADPAVAQPVVDQLEQDTGGGDDWFDDPKALPPGFPVTCLGVSGGIYHFLDALGQYRALEAFADDYVWKAVDATEPGEYTGIGPANSERMFDLLAQDALAGVEALARRDDIDPARIGIFGVSQAGWIAPLAASRSNQVAFVVLLSGPAVTVGEEIAYSKVAGEDPGSLQGLTDDEIAAKGRESAARTLGDVRAQRLVDACLGRAPCASAAELAALARSRT